MNSIRQRPGTTLRVPASAVEAALGRRPEQQDSAWAGPVRLAGGQSALLMLVADGMGGAVGGKLASGLALDGFRRQFEGSKDVTSLKTRLHSAVDGANEAIASAVAADQSLAGMGTTFIGAVVHGNSVTWVSVGDSLLLTIADGSLERLNEDHSLGSVLDAAAERGEISVTEARSSTQRNVLRSALTGGKIAMVELQTAPLQRGSWLIAATDGLLTLPFTSMPGLAALAKDPRSLALAILEAVKDDMPPDQDNVTVAVTRVTGIAGRRRIPRWAAAVIGVASAAFFVALAVLGALLTGDNDVVSPGNHVVKAASSFVKPAAHSTEADDAIAGVQPSNERVPVSGISTSGLVPVGTRNTLVTKTPSAPKIKPARHAALIPAAMKPDQRGPSVSPRNSPPQPLRSDRTPAAEPDKSAERHTGPI